MTMTAIQAQLLDLDAMDEAQCTSQVEHRCSGRAWYRAKTQCPEPESLWCVTRYAMHLSDTEQGYVCFTCDRSLGLCWTVLPV